MSASSDRLVRRPRRLGAVLAALCAALLLPAVGVASADTTAAWTDEVYDTVSVSAGTWGVDSASGCVWYVGGVPQPGATCSVTGATINQWSNGVDVVRDYYITVSMTGAGYPGSAKLDVDLTTLPGGGTWNWANAATLPDGAQLVPVGGYLCSELPALRANGPTGWSSTGDTYWIRIVENGSGPMGAGKNCA